MPFCAGCPDYTLSLGVQDVLNTLNCAKCADYGHLTSTSHAFAFLFQRTVLLLTFDTVALRLKSFWLYSVILLFLSALPFERHGVIGLGAAFAHDEVA